MTRGIFKTSHVTHILRNSASIYARTLTCHAHERVMSRTTMSRGTLKMRHVTYVLQAVSQDRLVPVPGNVCEWAILHSDPQTEEIGDSIITTARVFWSQSQISLARHCSVGLKQHEKSWHLHSFYSRSPLWSELVVAHLIRVTSRILPSSASIQTRAPIKHAQE